MEADVGDDIESVDFIKERHQTKTTRVSCNYPHPAYSFISLYGQESKEDNSKADAEMETDDNRSADIEKQPEGTEAEVDAEVEKVMPCPSVLIDGLCGG